MSFETPPQRPLRVAFVTAGLYFDPLQAQNRARYTALSAGCSGEIFGVIYDPSFRDYQLDAFRLRALSLPQSR